MSSDETAIPDEAVELALAAYRLAQGTVESCLRVALGAGLSVLRRHIADEDRADAFKWAADEVHREARWQREQLERHGEEASRDVFVDRLVAIESVLRGMAARVVRDGDNG